MPFVTCRWMPLLRALWLAALFTGLVPNPGASRADDAPDPLKPSAIVTADVPVVPPEFAARLQQYQNTRAAGFAGWDPAGKGIAIRTRFGNSLQMHRVYEPAGRREQITFFEEPVDGGFIPGAQDGAMLLSMSRGGNENYQVYLLDRKNFTTTLLTDGTSRNSLGAVREDGSQMVIGSNRRNGRDTDLYLANPRAADSMKLLLETDKQFWYAADWSPTGQSLLLLRYVSANEAYPALLDVHGQSPRPQLLPLPKEGKAAVGPLAFAQDGKGVYLATDALGQFRQLARLDLATKEYHWLSDDIPWDVSGLEVDPHSGQIAFAVNEDGASRLFLLAPNAADRSARRELQLPLGVLSSLDFSPDSRHLGFTLARPDAPADAYSLELASGKLTRWTFSEVGNLDPAKFITPERIRFKSFDGREIPAYIYRPRGATAAHPAPVLIQIHGGPESQAQPYFSGLTQFYLNELGVAVIVPNVRGSSGYGKEYLKLDNAERREDSVKDIGALLDWIGQQPDLDAARVAVTGGSYGGYMVLASLVHFGDRIKAGVDNVGIANFSTFLGATAPYRVDLRRAEYGDERDPQMQAVFERISPASHAEKIRSALLVAHGKNDPRVPFGEAEQIAAKVRAAGRPVWTVFADNEGHGFGKKDNADYLRAVEALFFQRHLK